MAKYESELTSFLRGLRKSHPELAREQAESRALWWDRQLDPDDLRRWEQSRVPQPAYVYFAPEPVKPAANS
ncbi:MAG TPA: DUF3460 family protein [Burkholderiaceae bacterium]|nr:DUF3460 family protein [Burkholderiaceae bacterium]